ncbi:MAG TPA: flagellar basal body-associated FliL family protein [Castellaniella sp.]|nr:flagellar basal body-associated FliL family protein [Castellaniella sp.]
MLVIIMGATVGGTMMFMAWQGGEATASSSASPVVPPPPPAPIFAELAPFTVTLYGETRNRILYTGITLRLTDQASRQIIEDYMPEVRDRVLKVLTSQEIARVQAPTGQETLAAALRASLTRPFAPQPQGPRIDDVLFTAFVVQ